MSAAPTVGMQGFVSGRIGSAADLPFCFPVSDGQPHPQTDPTGIKRIGWYASRTANSEKIGFVILGTERFAVTTLGATLTGTLLSTVTQASSNADCSGSGQGAIQATAGGIWCALQLRTGGAITASGNIIGASTVDCTAADTGSIQAKGGIWCAKILRTSSDIFMTGGKYIYLRGSDSVDGSCRLVSTASGSVTLQIRKTGVWTDIVVWT